VHARVSCIFLLIFGGLTTLGGGGEIGTQIDKRRAKNLHFLLPEYSHNNCRSLQQTKKQKSSTALWPLRGNSDVSAGYLFSKNLFIFAKR